MCQALDRCERQVRLGFGTAQPGHGKAVPGTGEIVQEGGLADTWLAPDDHNPALPVVDRVGQLVKGGTLLGPSEQPNNLSGNGGVAIGHGFDAPCSRRQQNNAQGVEWREPW